jgi:hypothetical protein
MTSHEVNKRVASHKSGHYESLGLKTILKNRTLVMASAKNGNTGLQLDIRVSVLQQLLVCSRLLIGRSYRGNC